MMANLLKSIWQNKTSLNDIWTDQRGQDMTEYALIAGLLTSVTCALVPEMMSPVTSSSYSRRPPTPPCTSPG
jgi:Flp pilus assembly pilin Flp